MSRGGGGPNAPRGRGRGGPPGGPGGPGGAMGSGGQGEKPKREAILDMTKYVGERIRVKFTGGREGESSLCCT